MSNRNTSWTAMLKWLQSLSLASDAYTWCLYMGHHCTGDTRIQQRPHHFWAVLRQMPTGIHLVLTELSFALYKSGIRLVWRPNAHFDLGNRCSLEYMRNTTRNLLKNLHLFLSLYFLNQHCSQCSVFKNNLVGYDGIFPKIIPRKQH